MIYWCNNCGIPYYSLDEKTCPICNMKGFFIANENLKPVFLQEKKLLSHILNRDITKENIWYKGNANYVINGKSERVPYVKYYKTKEYRKVMNELRDNIDLSDSIYNESVFLKANEQHIKSLIFEVEKYIVEITRKYQDNYTPIVSFSGGKDSTVVSRIVRDALQKNDIMHFLADTTLELPDTYNYYRKTFRDKNVYTPLLDSKPQSDFFKLCEYLGPPSRFERWCCTIFKTSNMNYFVQALPKNNGLLTFMGIRRNESNSRRNYKRTQYKSKISKQIVAMPIIDWSDFDVWLYIRYKQLSFNNAYKLGYRRVGCWCCPNNSHWSELLTAIYYPELYKKWENILYDFAKKTHKTDIKDYINNDRWKARKGASGLESRNVDILDSDCYSDKNAKNIILDKPIKDSFIEFIKPFGELVIQKKCEDRIVHVSENNNKVFSLYFKIGSKILKVISYEGYDQLLLIKRLKCQIRKYQFCIYCSACDATCPQLAISTLNGKYQIDEKKCTHCKTCISKFYNGCLTSEVLAEKKSGGE